MWGKKRLNNQNKCQSPFTKISLFQSGQRALTQCFYSLSKF